ncbi:MAG: hypothetical protein QOD93_5091 [Acetobacteraceae bacterium]|nr:hypothetical protein [Acetobacteraceae bacterium]
MIRPLTVATLLMACGSGLYLYQSKHEVQLLDRTIERTVRDTGALREQSRLLAAEWTMLNDPERLRQFSDTYLGLKTIAPSQFTSLADLDNRLPAAQMANSDHDAATQEPVPVATENPALIEADPGSAAVADEALPVPPVPAPPPLAIVATAAHVTEPRIPDRVLVSRQTAADNQARAAADARPPDQRSSDQHPAARVADARVDPRASVAAPLRPVVVAAPLRASVAAPSRPVAVAEPRPAPANPPSNPPVAPRAYASSAPAPAPVSSASGMAAPSVAYGGSLLGMARGAMPPAPRPTPVNASYNAN